MEKPTMALPRRKDRFYKPSNDVTVRLAFRFTMKEAAELPEQQRTALLRGIAEVLAAKGGAQ